MVEHECMYYAVDKPTFIIHEIIDPCSFNINISLPHAHSNVPFLHHINSRPHTN
jgi:hypothetical protein